MTCHAHVLGLDLMHLLGWVSIHDTHHHMGVFERKFLWLVFLVYGFLGCYSPTPLTESCPRD